jgi:hypothetical protein
VPKVTDVDMLMKAHLEELGLRYYPEFRFEIKRRWKFDWIVLAIKHGKLAIEIEGGVWSRGRHVRGKGFLNDCEKYNRAACLGWSILRFTPDQIRRGEDIPVIREWLANRA